MTTHKDSILDQFTRQAVPFTTAPAPGGRVIVADSAPAPDRADAFNRMERLRDPSHARAMPVDEHQALYAKAGLSEPRVTWYRLEGELEALIARSFPNPGDDDKIRALFRASLADDALGIQTRLENGQIRYGFPVLPGLARRRRPRHPDPARERTDPLRIPRRRARRRPVTAMRIVDLSFSIRPHFRWKVASQLVAAHASGHPLQSTVLTISCHAYTHVDAPLHYLIDGRDMTAMPVDQWVGEAAVVDLTYLGANGEVTAEDLKRRAEHLRARDIVLLRPDSPKRVSVET